MTPDTARDEMLAVFKTVWDATGYPVLWPDVPGAPPASGPYARVTVRHAVGKQTSLSSATGAKLVTHMGTLWISVFIPIGQGGTTGYTLVQSILGAYRAARGSVWYRNPRFREVPDTTGAYSHFNTMIDFTYDT